VDEVEVPPTDDGGSKALDKEVESGREELTREILALAKEQVPRLGIELVDVRIKRINYVPSVQKQVFGRMISERERIAAQFRSEGEGESAEILGETERDLKQILSDARRQAEIIRGRADAEATAIYNDAYNADPEFYAFYRSLESYGKSLTEGTTLILSTDSDYFRYLRDIMDPEARGPSTPLAGD
jgi:membrane protease subunit HflC